MSTFSWQLKALMKKNLILMKRNCITTFCEIFFPMILIAFLALFKILFPLVEKTNIMEPQEFVLTNSTAILANLSEKSFYGLKVATNPL